MASCAERKERPITPSICRWSSSAASMTSLLLLVAISLSFRLVDIQRSLWLDELHTSWTVNDSVQEVAHRAAAGNQGTVYFYACWAFVRIMGHSELSLRMLSVISGVVLSVLAYYIVRLLTGSLAIGLLAAFLIAIDPYFIEYSQEARPYAFLQLVGLIQVYFFGMRWCEVETSGVTSTHSSRISRFHFFGFNRIGLIISTAFGFYIHYTSILLTVSLAIITIVGNAVLGRKLNGVRLAPLTDLLSGLLLCLPAIPAILEIFDRRGNWELFVNDQTFTLSIMFQITTYLVPSLLAVSALLLSREKDKSPPILTVMTILFFVYLFPILFSWIALKTGTAALYHQRYFMIGWPALVLSGSLAIRQASRSSKRWVIGVSWLSAIAMICCSLAFNPLLSSVIRQGNMPFESSWRAAIHYLNREYQDGQLLYVFSNLIEDGTLCESLDFESGTEEAQTFQTLEDYCAFPVKGIYQADTSLIVPKPTLFRPRFGVNDRQRMQQAGQFVMLIRGDQSVIDDILYELAKYGVENGIFIRGLGQRFFEIRGAPHQFIALFQFEVVEPTK